MTQSSKANQSRYWRSLQDLDNTPEFEEMLRNEFPQAASEFPKGISRRRWLQLMGASLALGAAGCRFETETIAPFVKRPQNRVPGESTKYATTIEVAGKAEPLLVTTYDGRPIKIDGMPEHPLSNGAASNYAQACILDLYDPDRSRDHIYREGDRVTEKTKEEFNEFLAEQMVAFGSNEGEGLCVLAEPSHSPTLHRLRGDLLSQFPKARWFDYASVNEDNISDGANLAFGKPVRPLYQLENAKIVLSLDADPLRDHPTGIRNSRGWAEARDADHGKINRTYAVESRFSVTGMSADHRLPLRSDQLFDFLKSLAAEVQARRDQEDGGSVTSDNAAEKFLQAVAQDLATHPSECAIFVGRNHPPEVHALAFSLMESLIGDEVANVDRPIIYIDEPFAAENNAAESLKELVDLADAGSVETLIVIGGNPVYDAPRDSRLQEVLLPTKIKNRVQLSYYVNDTSAVCSWHVPMAHALESWGDAVLYDGSWGVSQPMIEPLFDGISASEFVAQMLGEAEVDGMELVKETATQNAFSPGDQKAWEKLIHDGFLADSGATPITVEATAPTDVMDVNDDWKTKDFAANTENGSLEVVLSAHSSIYDGRFANNSWLQELPDSVTKVTWGNCASVSPATAEKLGLEQNKIVKIAGNGSEIEVPVYIQPGQAPGSISVELGYGRKFVGHVGGNTEEGVDIVGTDTNLLRTMDSPFHCSKVTVTSTGTEYVLGTTQDHNAIDVTGLDEINRRMGSLVREGDFDSYQAFLEEHAHADEHEHDDEHEEDHDHEHHHAQWPDFHLHFPNVDLNPGPDYTTENKWGMSIDLNKCTGCNACVVACQSENNIPVVGVDQVRRGREMHWLRIDRYFGGDDRENPRVVTQPVTCHHCEKAPCETVCPVAATVHSREGLNDMVYNRCVGTRYCGNNCPYKVRRFNYLNYTEAVTFIKYPWADKLSEANKQLRGLVMNPEVSVRSRGVMEKCSYCVQRIQNTKIKARNEGNRPIGPNEVTTACQDACPTDAILFGDLNNEKSDVHAAHKSPRSYTMLEELNIIPRTKYMARVRNPHPALKPKEEKEEAGAH